MRTGKNLRNRYFYRLLKRIVKDKNKIGSTFKKEDLIEAFVKYWYKNNFSDSWIDLHWINIYSSFFLIEILKITNQLIDKSI